MLGPMILCLDTYHRLMASTMMQVSALRMLFDHSTSPGGLAGDRKGNVTASAFSLSAQTIWKAITDDRDLDLPSHKVI